jgi:predicted acetyltransferase
MSIEIRTATDADWEPLCHADGRAFGFTYTEEMRNERRPMMDLDRFRLAFDGSEIVGLAGSYAFDVTMPGGTCVPAGGLTWVGVAATHRRQGVLRSLMDACHQDMIDRGEPVSLLHASEGGIYERFGYGIAHVQREVEIDVRNTAIRDEFRVPAGSVRYIDGDAAFDHMVEVWERFRRTRAGELSRNMAWHEFVRGIRSRSMGEASAAFHLAHTDGFASYRIKDDWHKGSPNHTLELVEFAAVTPEAHLALWQVLLSVDLVATISRDFFPTDDALPYLLTNPRAVRTKSLADGVWALPLDVSTLFGARSYGTTDRLVVEVDGKRWSFDGSPEGGEVKAVRSKPDLVMQMSALGALVLGGVRPSALAVGRRLTARNDDVLRRADRFFLGDRDPASTTMF